MSIQAMTWVIDNSKQTGLGFVTLLMIANHANAEGHQAFPSMKTLARECRTSLRSVQRVILKLERGGELGVDRSGGRVSHSYSLPLMLNMDTESTLHPHQRRQGGHVKDAQRGQQVPTLQRRHPDHVESQRGQMESPNVDTVGPNVDIAVSTDPLEPSLEKKEPSAHAELITFHAGFLDGPLLDAPAQGKALKILLEHYSTEECKSYYLYLRGETWRTTAVSWLTVKRSIGDWLARGRTAKEPNSNGHKPQVELDPFGEPFVRKPFTAEDAIRLSPGKNPDDVRANFEGRLAWEDVRCL